MSKRIDLTGRVFGRLTVIEYAGSDSHWQARWRCRCECGAEKVILGASLVKGHTVSCGCFAREVSREGFRQRKTLHGQSRTRLYGIWHGIITRCCNARHPNYRLYGGRGIKVSERWRNFSAFFDDMAGGYESGLSIDRIDVNGDYCKENCRWVARAEQAQNRRNTVYVFGVCLAKYCRDNGISVGAVRARIRNGWPPEKAVSVPVRKKKGDG